MINSGATGNFRDLKVWHKAMSLAGEVYKIVRLLPREEVYALSDQLRRAAVSVPSNIAEGHGRNSEAEFIRFLYISKGSLNEIETQLELSVRFGYIDNGTVLPVISLANETRTMIAGLIKFLESQRNRDRNPSSSS